jgi:hypothetical protein
MGSFAASVALAERLRPFAAAGLELLYLPGGLADEGALAESASEPLAEALATQITPESAPAALPVDAWPAPWSTLFARVRTTPRVIITYASLADDVAGNADPARRKLFQSILSFLAWPQGTTLFWPISFPTGVDPGPHFAADVFAAGVQHFGIKHLLCFGERPVRRAATLFPQEGKSTPVVIHAAPEPEALIPLLPHELHRALASLKSIQLL